MLHYTGDACYCLPKSVDFEKDAQVSCRPVANKRAECNRRFLGNKKLTVEGVLFT